MEALLRLAGGAGVAGVHVQAVRAAVDLRGTDLHGLLQAVLEAAGVHLRAEVEYGLGCDGEISFAACMARVDENFGAGRSRGNAQEACAAAASSM